MKVLLIAYEFPPILAAQALRWYYLANGLAALGVEVDVVCPDMPAAPPFHGLLHERVHVHRTWPGPFVGLSQKLARVGATDQGMRSAAAEPSEKQSIMLMGYRLIRNMLDMLLYPDVRTEWLPFARRRIQHLMASRSFDAAISSHEPGVDLLLGLWLKKRFDLPWLVDLADPLLAPYSPPWRRWIDRRVERHVLATADRVLVTTPGLVDLLAERHGEDLRRHCHVVPQGFPAAQEPTGGATRPRTMMEILFTGTLYQRFRNPVHLAEALRRLASSEIALTIVGDNAGFQKMFEGTANVRFLGKQDHFVCLEMQRRADVLLNIGNSQDFQIPGKVYEYLGAGPPILHIRKGLIDQGAKIVEQTGAGLVVDDNVESISVALMRLVDSWRAGYLERITERHDELIAQHSWDERARLCLTAIALAVRRDGHERPPEQTA